MRPLHISGPSRLCTQNVRPYVFCVRCLCVKHTERTDVRFLHSDGPVPHSLSPVACHEGLKTYGRTFFYFTATSCSEAWKNVRTYVFDNVVHSLLAGKERTDVRFLAHKKRTDVHFFFGRRTTLCCVKTQVALCCHYNPGLAMCSMQQGVSQGVSHFTLQPSTDIKTYGRTFLCTHHSQDPLPGSRAPDFTMSGTVCGTSWKLLGSSLQASEVYLSPPLPPPVLLHLPHQPLAIDTVA